MSISFAGISLLMTDPDGTADDFIRKYLELPHSLVNPPRRTLDNKSRVQRPLWPAEPTLKVNQLCVPSGASRWAKFIGLATLDQKNAILAAINPPPSSSSSSSSRVPTYVPASGTLSFSAFDQETYLGLNSVVTGNSVDSTFDIMLPWSAPMWLLPPVPVSQAPNSLWLIPLVDSRYFNQQQSINWDGTAPAVSSSSSPGPAAGSWDALLATIQAAMSGITITRDTGTAISAQYGAPDNCIFQNGIIDAAAALDLYCWSTNQRLVPLSAGLMTTFILRSATTAPSLYLAESQAQSLTGVTGGAAAGADFDNTLVGDVPSNITFHFDNDSATPVLEYAQPFANAPSYAGGGNRDLMCPAQATGLNNSTLKGMADQWSADWWKWTAQRFSWGFNRILNWHFTGYEDYVLYDMSRRGKGTYQARTFVKTLPPGIGYDFVPLQISGVTRTCSTGGSGGGGGDAPCGCCNCLNCINQSQATVGGCTACGNGAPSNYTVNVGTFGLYPMLGGDINLLNSCIPGACFGSSSSSASPTCNECQWTSCPITVTPAPWLPKTYYIAGDYVGNSGSYYVCTSAGTSAATGGPTGSGSGIIDNTVSWNFVS